MIGPMPSAGMLTRSRQPIVGRLAPAGLIFAPLTICKAVRRGQAARNNSVFPLAFEADRLGDLDPEAGEADIVTLAGRDEADGMDAQVAQDLGAEPDVAPDLVAGSAFARLAFRRPDRH